MKSHGIYLFQSDLFHLVHLCCCKWKDFILFMAKSPLYVCLYIYVSFLVAHPWDQRKNLETVTKSSKMYCTGNLTSQKHKVVEWHPTPRADGRQEAAAVLATKGEKEVTIYRGNWCQTGSPVSRRTSRGASLCQPLRLTVAKGARRSPLMASLGGVVLLSALEQSLPGTGGHTCSGYCWGSGVEREDGSRGKAGTISKARDPPSWRAWPYTCQTQPL